MDLLKREILIVFLQYLFSEIAVGQIHRVSASQKLDLNINRNLVGVVYSPYTKLIDNCTIPGDHDYMIEEIMQTLEVVSTKFTKVAHARNIRGNNANSQQQNAEAFVAKAAAMLNRKYQTNKIRLTQAYLYDYPATTNEKEEEYAEFLDEVTSANKIFPRTISEITLVEYAENSLVSHFTLHLKRISNMSNKVKTLGIKLGFHIWDCERFFKESSSAVRKEFVQNLDYVVCIQWLDEYSEVDIKRGPDHVVGNMTLNSEKYIQEFKKLKPSLTVISQSGGWPTYKCNSASYCSSDIFPSDQKTSQNMQAYWNGLSKWAQSNRQRVWLEQAFDTQNVDGYPLNFYAGWWIQDNRKIIEKIYDTDGLAAADIYNKLFEECVHRTRPEK